MSLRRSGRRTRVRDGERGAAAVEFALVCTVLLTIVFGILQYGLYFNDSLNARQGVRETARMTVVHEKHPACQSSTGWSAVSCTAEKIIGEGASDTWVKISAPTGWAKGKVLRVCVIVRSRSHVGMLPMPNDGYVHASLEMSIEEETPALNTAGLTETAPTGQSWSWCA